MRRVPELVSGLFDRAGRGVRQGRRTSQPRLPAADSAAAAAPAPATPQAIVTVLYNQPKDAAAFEQYYSATHLPLVTAKQSEIGFTKAELTKFTTTLDGKQPPFYRQAELYFTSMDDAKKGMATPGFKKVADDLANFATGGLLGMLAVETGDKGEAACPGPGHRHLRHADGPRGVRVLLHGHPPAAGGRRPAGDRVRAGRPHEVRVEPGRLAGGGVSPGGALLQVDGRPEAGVATPAFKEVSDDLGKFATGGLDALIGEQQ